MGVGFVCHSESSSDSEKVAFHNSVLPLNI
jgi:hypothetical protein